MKTTFFLLLVILNCYTGFAQSSTSKRALKAYNNMFYAEAADLYQSEVDRTGGTAEDLIKLADCYSKLQEYIDAELTLEKLFKMSSAQPQPIILKYAQVLAQNERYEESMKYYKKYTLDSRGKNFYEAYWSLNKFYRDSANVAVRFLPINSLQSEFSPAIYQKGIVFSSNRKLGGALKRVDGRNQTPFTDLYYLKDTNVFKRKKVSDNVLAAIRSNTGNKKYNPDYTAETSNDSRTVGHYDPYYLEDNEDEENFMPVDPFESGINSKYHEGPVSFTKNFDTIFFTRNSYNNGSRKRDDNKVTKLKIFFAVRNSKGQYEHVQEFPFNNPDYSVGHPAVSPDSKRLYFVTDKQGGFGETDIYYCDIREHRFTEPVNAGPVINTPGSEMFPAFSKDGSLFFSSNGHAGLGGLDIFRAEETNNQFQTPRNLRFPINSSKDDFGICSSDLHGNTGYLSSNRLRGRGDDNIYSYVDNRPPRILVKGTIKAKHFDDDGKVYIEPLQGATVTILPLGDKVETDRSGTFEFLVNRGKEYTIEGEKEKLGKDRKTIDLVKAAADLNTLPVELILEPAGAGIPYTAQILESKSKQPIKEAFVYLYDVESKKADKFKTDSNGRFTAPLQPDHHYIVKSYAAGFFSDCYKLSSIPKGGGSLNIENMNLKKVQSNATFEVKNLLYDYDKTDIRPDAAEVLDKVARFLKEYPEIVVELGSHTDSRGSDEYNQSMSAKRAKAAVDYIVSQGVDSSRIVGKGYGETKILNKCKNDVKCSELQHQQNRRTEVKVTGIKQQDSAAEKPDVDPETVFQYLKDFNDCKEYKLSK